jgi:hypothetical protein
MPDTKLYDPAKDLKQASFKLNLNNQDFDFSIMSLVSNDQIFFYVVFKPLEYDHIINMSQPSSSWSHTAATFASIFQEICNQYNINKGQYPEIENFIKSSR